MLLALALVVGAITATTKSADIQGPSALAVLADQSIWVSVEDAMWHLDGNGQRLQVVAAATLGVGGPIGNLVLHPNGQLVASVRNDPTLYFLDPESALVKSRLLPQWQPDLSRHGSDAINYAFHDDGRVAIATGGGHAVATFDAAGNFLGRTKPGTYEFTNGLWWVGDVLWTTDTNRQELVELDGNTLTEKSRVPLSKNCGGWQFLGMAAPSHGKASEATRTTPLATLIRFANGMTKGHATDVFSDGSQLNYPVIRTQEPRDIKWRGNELLLVDGASFALKRYSDDRTPMDDFGDAQTQSELGASLARRKNLEWQYSAYLIGAVIVFLIGFAVALRASALEKARNLAALNVDMSQLGTPILSASARFIAGVKISWPSLLAIGVLVLCLLYLDKIAGVARTASLEELLLTFVASLLLLVATLIFLRRNLRRSEDNPVTEAIFNHRAVQFLQTEATFWRLRQPNELPQETFMLASARGGLRWLVLTNQRLLVFVANLRDRTLAHEYLRSDILQLRILDTQEMTLRQKIQRYLSVIGAVIRIEFKDGSSLTGFTPAAQTAKRMATQLDSSSASAMHPAPLTQAALHTRVTKNTAATRQTIASFLIPGLGQWMQNRSGTALLFFVSWLLILMAAVAVAWTLWKSLSAVSLPTILSTASYYIFVCVLAAGDAWRMREHQQ